MRFSETPRGNIVLWIAQGALAILYLLAGGMKLFMPVEVLAAQTHLPGLFMKFIGLCEVAGGLGLILPEILRTARVLTPIAAAGLVVIMTGATLITLARAGLGAALIPFVAGLLDAFVIYGRWPREWPRWSSPHAAR